MAFADLRWQPFRCQYSSGLAERVGSFAVLARDCIDLQKVEMPDSAGCRFYISRQEKLFLSVFFFNASFLYCSKGFIANSELIFASLSANANSNVLTVLTPVYVGIISPNNRECNYLTTLFFSPWFRSTKMPKDIVIENLQTVF